MSDIQTQIKNAVESTDIVLFMKGDKGMPACGYSALANQVLDLLGVEFEAINVLASEEVRQGIKEYSDWPTIPQLYIKGEFIGGADIMREMFENGELLELINNKGIANNPKELV
ncbi:MAG: Grx4 family monothiol glutaredoxin [Alphaproteobacteria bacterium]